MRGETLEKHPPSHQLRLIKLLIKFLIKLVVVRVRGILKTLSGYWRSRKMH